MKDRLRNRFNASVAEVDALDKWQHAVMGVCMISNDKSYLEKQYKLGRNGGFGIYGIGVAEGVSGMVVGWIEKRHPVIVDFNYVG